MTAPQAPSTIEFIARALAVRGDRVLLCRSVKKGYFYLPGGHVDAGEQAVAACARELVEETGLHAIVGECLAFAEVIFATGKRRHHEINVVFHVELAAGGGDDGALLPPDVPSLEEHISFEWIDRAALTDLDLRPRALKAWLVAGGDLADVHHPTWISDVEI